MDSGRMDAIRAHVEALEMDEMKTVYVVTITRDAGASGNIIGVHASMGAGKAYFENNAAANDYHALSEWAPDFEWGNGESAFRKYRTMFEGIVFVRVIPFAVLRRAKPESEAGNG
jgi:hypothetical protein